mgnify:CR=1 FL=1
MSQLSVALGRVIRTSRKSAGLSQEALALQAKVDRSYVGRIERGEANITIHGVDFRLQLQQHPQGR